MRRGLEVELGSEQGRQMHRVPETAVGMYSALSIRAGGRWGPYNVGWEELVDVRPVRVVHFRAQHTKLDTHM